LKDELGLKHLDVRLVGLLSACSVRMPRPRPDGTPGQKWAILQLDDGNSLDAFCFGKPWEEYNEKLRKTDNDGKPIDGSGPLETSVDRLVMLCGEVSHRINYGNDDKVEKKNPQIGDLNFTVKEAYPLDVALGKLSNGMRIRLRHEDERMMERFRSIQQAISRSPGQLPVFLEIVYANGDTVEVDLGPLARVSVTVSFLSELSKIVPQSDTAFCPSSKIYPDEDKRRQFGGARSG
jgi:hypothetical protein